MVVSELRTVVGEKSNQIAAAASPSAIRCPPITRRSHA
jgi:hypothetical protein